jgi:hypothetical protein
LVSKRPVSKRLVSKRLEIKASIPPVFKFDILIKQKALELQSFYLLLVIMVIYGKEIHLK